MNVFVMDTGFKQSVTNDQGDQVPHKVQSGMPL